MALSKNYGFCKGNNIGFEHSKGIYIVCLNNDTYLSRTWLEELVKTMDSDSSIGICQSRIVDFEKKHTLYGNFLGIYGKRKIGKLFKIEGDLFEGAFYASGTAIIIRREMIEMMEYLFDDKQYSGDMDLSWRARLMGFRVVTNLRSICYHYHGYSRRKILKNDLSVGYVVSRDKLQTFIKNYGFYRLCLRVPVLVFVDFFDYCYISTRSHLPVVYSLPKAILWNLSNFRDTWKKHVQMQTKRKVSDNIIESYMLPYPEELYFLRIRLRSRIS